MSYHSSQLINRANDITSLITVTLQTSKQLTTKLKKTSPAGHRSLVTAPATRNPQLEGLKVERLKTDGKKEKMMRINYYEKILPVLAAWPHAVGGSGRWSLVPLGVKFDVP